MTRALAFVACLSAAAGVAFSAPVRTPRKPAAALPDSVIARFPHRDLTEREFVDSWQRLDPRYRPTGAGLEQKRAFLDQLVEREVIARAADAEPFVMTKVESAQFVAMRNDAIRRKLYLLLIADSTVATAADRDSARIRLTASGRGQVPTPQAIETYSRSLAEPRRVEEFNARLKTALALAWDDSVASRIARAYGQLDPTKPDLSKPFSLKLNRRVPPLAPADTGRALARSTAGTLSAAEFTRRFALLDPFKNEFPTTAGMVKARGEQFLGQMWFDQEAERRGLANDPGVLATLASRRESIALDHYFARHVQARVDTSDAVLRAFYEKNKAQYAIPGHSVVSNVVTPGQASADSILAELTAGAPWDSICARHVAEGDTRAQCGGESTLPDDYADSLLVKDVAKLAPGAFLTHPMAVGAPGSVVVLKMIRRVPYRMRTFEEVRSFTVRGVSSEQSEVLLQAELARLEHATPVTRNERALARVTLPEGAEIR